MGFTPIGYVGLTFIESKLQTENNLYAYFSSLRLINGKAQAPSVYD